MRSLPPNLDRDRESAVRRTRGRQSLGSALLLRARCGSVFRDAPATDPGPIQNHRRLDMTPPNAGVDVGTGRASCACLSGSLAARTCLRPRQADSTGPSAGRYIVNRKRGRQVKPSSHTAEFVGRWYVRVGTHGERRR